MPVFLFIIFGTKGVTFNAGEGKFHCPNCDTRRTYWQKRVRRFFALYFIPLIPLDLLAEYVECQSCKGTWRGDAKKIGVGHEQALAQAEAEFQTTMRRLMIMMMLADGEVAPEEVSTIAEYFAALTGKEIDEAAIRAEAEQVGRSTDTIDGYMVSMRPYLNEQGKEMILKAAILVAGADGEFDETEGEFLANVAGQMEMSQAHFRGVLAEMAAPPEDEGTLRLPN